MLTEKKAFTTVGVKEDLKLLGVMNGEQLAVYKET